VTNGFTVAVMVSVPAGLAMFYLGVDTEKAGVAEGVRTMLTSGFAPFAVKDSD
jgi:hypothetical protein